ncbi:MAG: isochorismatase family protein [Phycisphaerae bacterium]|jgi:nicotinamidase-related amidase
MATKSSVKWGRVLIDVCTQRDYLGNKAILQVSNRDPLIENLRKVFAWTQAAGVGVVSLVESHRPTEMLAGFPLHCIDGTAGQEKLPFTLLDPRVLVEADNSLSLPPDLCEKHRQIIFRKRSRDVLGNPKADRFLTQLPVEEMLIVGVGLERAIKGLALGLLSRHQPVTVVLDACGYWSSADADLSSRQLAAKGIKLMTVEELLVRPTPRPRRVKPRVRAVRNRHHPAGGRASSPATSKR